MAKPYALTYEQFVPSNLDDLDDVILSVATPSNNDVLAYSTTTGKWSNVRRSSLFSAYTAVTSTYPITSLDETINCTSGTFTVTLPTAVGVTGKVYNIKNSGTGSITVATTSSQTIDGNTSGTLVLTQYDNLTVLSNGANWIIL